MCEKYNGWSNYATWCVKSWIDNDETLHRRINRLGKKCYNNARAGKYLSREEETIFDFQYILKHYIEKLNPLYKASMFADLLGWALEEVNWYELSKSIIIDNITENSK